MQLHGLVTISTPRRRDAGMFVLLAALSACLSERTEFVVCGDVNVPEDIDTLRLSLLDNNLTELRAGVLELVGSETGEVQPLPLSSTLASASGPGWVRVEGIADGIVVSRFDRRAPELEGLDRVAALLSLDCDRVFCPNGQTCLDGECALAPGPGDPPSCSVLP